MRSAEKREVMHLVNQDFSQQLEERGWLPAPRELTLAQMQSYCDRGRAVLCLISSYRLTGDKAPHWVLVVGVDQQFVWFHDPDADEQHQLTSHAYIPVTHREFRQMSSYGRQRYSAALVIDLD